jgi:hypothetical protein
LGDYYITTIRRFPIAKNRYRPDDLFSSWFEEEGIDVHELRKRFSLTPPSIESVYKDYFKYVDKVLVTVPYVEAEKGMLWLCQFKRQRLRKQCILYNYDTAVTYIDRSKSATAIWNTHCRTKGEVLDSEDFKTSYVIFLYRFLLGEPALLLWLANRKEEIRPTEKIEQLAIRSFIIASVYALITNHMVNMDHDLLTATEWFEYQTGMGMSLFNQNYDKKMKPFENRPFKKFYDVSKWDARQHHFLRRLEIFSVTAMYGQNKTSFYWLLGSLAVRAKDLGMPDFPVLAHTVRERLLESETFGPVILPHGEICHKDRGKNSGDGRTTGQNVGCHKIMAFTAGGRLYDELDDYLAANLDDETGDDKIWAGDVESDFEEQVKVLKEYGYELDVHHCESFYDLEYLSTKPIKITHFGNEYIVPQVNSQKVIAALCDKLEKRDKDTDYMRLVSAKILCYWTKDYPIVKAVEQKFLQLNPDMIRSRLNKTDDFILEMYIGHFEKLTPHPEFMDFLEDVASEYCGTV